jgi:hypothetical protein
MSFGGWPYYHFMALKKCWYPREALEKLENGQPRKLLLLQLDSSLAAANQQEYPRAERQYEIGHAFIAARPRSDQRL